MTNQEFIDSLSQKAKKIITNYQYKNINKTDIIVYLNNTVNRVNMDHPNTYIIEIKKQESLYDMKYAFLHEFCHYIQSDSGFPYINYINVNYKTLSECLSSIVLDCDVYNRLLEKWYKENPNILHSEFNNIYDTLFVISREKKFGNYLNDIDHQIYYAGKLVILSKFYDNDINVKSITNLVKNKFPIIYKDYNIFINAIKRYGFTSPKSVRKIFKTIIRELKIDEFVTIM